MDTHRIFDYHSVNARVLILYNAFLNVMYFIVIYISFPCLLIWYSMSGVLMSKCMAMSAQSSCSITHFKHFLLAHNNAQYDDIRITEESKNRLC